MTFILSRRTSVTFSLSHFVENVQIRFDLMRSTVTQSVQVHFSLFNQRISKRLRPERIRLPFDGINYVHLVVRRTSILSTCRLCIHRFPFNSPDWKYRIELSGRRGSFSRSDFVVVSFVDDFSLLFCRISFSHFAHRRQTTWFSTMTAFNAKLRQTTSWSALSALFFCSTEANTNSN